MTRLDFATNRFSGETIDCATGDAHSMSPLLGEQRCSMAVGGKIQAVQRECSSRGRNGVLIRGNLCFIAIVPCRCVASLNGFGLKLKT
jgi:hypothetical protein